MPNRASDELVWDEPEDSAPGMTRAQVVQAALDLADAEGLEAVSIRRVARELDVRPMSLYTHIASKDDLIALMLHEISGRLLVPEPLPAQWREALTAIASRAYAEYVAHPWTMQAFGRGARVGPNMLRRAEQSTAAVASLELDPADAWTALSVVHEWTLGRALHLVTLREDVELESQLRTADPEQFPGMSKVFGAGREARQDSAFEAALEVVLDGIERRYVEGKASEEKG